MRQPALQLLRDADDRKGRGAYFTPPAMATFLTKWAVAGRQDATVLDPTCGEGVFLEAAANQLRTLGCTEAALDEHVWGVDVHEQSVRASSARLEGHGVDARFVCADFCSLGEPGSLMPSLPAFDAVVGNPPYIRYQKHTGEARRASLAAALRHGVRLSGLASSWAATLVHAASFLKPDGRLAMVLPAELLTVGYAEPVRRWLCRRFAAVRLVIFERLQFDDALEHVVLLLAEGAGGCDAFSLYFAGDASDLEAIQPMSSLAVTLSSHDKWTDLLLPASQRQIFRRVIAEKFCRLAEYGAPELGTVTGANHYFTLSEQTRVEYQLEEGRHVVPTSPPGTRHLKGLSFSSTDWRELRAAGERVWMLHPEMDVELRGGFARYVAEGEGLGIPAAYKCHIRPTWWRPPAAPQPDLFFTYMSHRFPRLIANTADCTYLNSMHGVRLRNGVKRQVAHMLPLLALNSGTILGAELFGRSYGGGILKMEPREAANLPVPTLPMMEAAWHRLREKRSALDRELRNGRWTNVIAQVDITLLHETMGISLSDVEELRDAASSLRTRRLSRERQEHGE